MLPQAVSVCAETHVPFLQQPVGHVVLLHFVVSLHTPNAVSQVFPPLHVVQVFPYAPQLALLIAVTQVFPEQQPSQVL